MGRIGRTARGQGVRGRTPGTRRVIGVVVMHRGHLLAPAVGAGVVHREDLLCSAAELRGCIGGP